MRAAMVTTAAALALAGCVEGNRVLDDPKYNMGGDTQYGRYLVVREAALLGQREVPQVVPVARPYRAPTAAEIEGPTGLQIAEREAAIVTAQTVATVTGRPIHVGTSASVPDVIARPTTAAPSAARRATGATGGGYYDPDTGRPASVVAPAAVPVVPLENPRRPVVGVTGAGPVTPAAPLAAPPATSGAARPATDALTRYAFSQRHAPGTAVYRREGGSAAGAARQCARFPNQAAAQLAFMASGGPRLDPMGLDPDGDGFVCGWDPAPYRIERL